MKIGDIYYEKHTVLGISHRNGEVSETQIEVVKDVIPLSVIDDIKAEIEAYQSDAFYPDNVMMNKRMVLEIIDKYRGDKHET